MWDDRVEKLTIGITSDYSKFKFLQGNRDITRDRIEQLKDSIIKIGYIESSLILCNEKFEIIDGQARFMALKELKMEIRYYIKEGIGIEECRTMNIHQKNWTISDFVDSYCNLDTDPKNSDYIRYRQLYNILEIHEITLLAIDGFQKTDDLKNGTLELDIDKYCKAKLILEFVRSAMPYFIHIECDSKYIMGAIIETLKYSLLDTKKLEASIQTKANVKVSAYSLRDGIKCIENLYNRKYTGIKMHICDLYEHRLELAKKEYRKNKKL